MPQIQLVEPEGTYLAWLDCRELGMTDDELMAFFSDDAKVWLDPGTHSGEQGSGFMRFNLGSSRSVIAQALDQIEAAWKKRNAQ
ncbi:aminotransferase class I and II [Clostridium sp. CAG:43]|nr:aminotransferase class I and II [Clostridium sp. CAG:43]